MFGKERGRNGRRPGPPVHDDLVRRNFTAEGPNRLWLRYITEHHPAEGKLDLCAITDVYSGRIVGYRIDSRMKSRLVVSALHSSVARRGEVAGYIVHSDLGSQFRSRKFLHALNTHGPTGSMGKVGAWGTTRLWRASLRSCNATCSTANAGTPVNSFGSRSSRGSNGRTYHRRRRQVRLGRLTPVEFEAMPVADDR